MRSSLNPQDDKNWNSLEENLTKYLCLLIISENWIAFGGYNEFK